MEKNSPYQLLSIPKQLNPPSHSQNILPVTLLLMTTDKKEEIDLNSKFCYFEWGNKVVTGYASLLEGSCITITTFRKLYKTVPTLQSGHGTGFPFGMVDHVPSWSEHT